MPGCSLLGSAAFMAVGAYAAFNLSLRLPGLPLPVSLLLAGLVAALAGLVAGAAGPAAARLLPRGLDARRAVLRRLGAEPDRLDLRRQPLGRHHRPRLVVAGLSFDDPRGRYLFSLSVVTLLTVLAWRLAASPTGRDLVAIRDNETAARLVGVKVARTKLLAFAVSSFVIGIAGALWAFAYLRTVEPAGFNLDRSFQILFIVIIGGLGTLRGAFPGAGFIVVLPLLPRAPRRGAPGRRVRFRHPGDGPAHRARRPDRRRADPRARRPRRPPRPGGPPPRPPRRLIPLPV